MTNEEVAERFTIIWNGGELLGDYPSATSLTEALQDRAQVGRDTRASLARESRQRIRLTEVNRKVCIRCGKSKPLAEFYAHPKTADRLFATCKRCVNHSTSLRWRLKQRESRP